MPGQDIVPVGGSSSSLPDEVASLAASSEAEGMDTQQSEAGSQSSNTDPQSSELERNDGSTSSLSLSSERLEEGGIVALPLPISDRVSMTTSRRTQASSAAVLSSRTITILSSNNNSTAQASFLQSLGSEITTYEPAAAASSSPHLESSVDPSSSQLSLDSSNGSSSQGDVSQTEVEVDEGLRFSASTRTSSDSNLPSQSRPLERISSASRSTSSLSGTSVIVEPNNSRGSLRGRGTGEGRQQRRQSQQPPSSDDESGSSSRSAGQITGKDQWWIVSILKDALCFVFFSISPGGGGMSTVVWGINLILYLLLRFLEHCACACYVLLYLQ